MDVPQNSTRFVAPRMGPKLAFPRRLVALLFVIGIAAAACGQPIDDATQEQLFEELEVLESTTSTTSTTTMPPVERDRVLADYTVTIEDGSSFNVNVEMGELARFGDDPSVESLFVQCAGDPQRDAYVPITARLTNTTPGFGVSTEHYWLRFIADNNFLVNFGDIRGCKETPRFAEPRVQVSAGFDLDERQSGTLTGGLIIYDVYTPAHPDGNLRALDGAISYAFEQTINPGEFSMRREGVEGVLPLTE